MATQRARSGSTLFADATPAGDKSLMPPDIEAAIAFQTVLVIVDLRKVMPDAQQVAITKMVDEFEDAGIGMQGQLLQCQAATLRQQDAAEQDIAATHANDSVMLASADRLLAGPHLKAAVTSAQHWNIHPQRCAGHLRKRQRATETDHAQHMPCVPLDISADLLGTKVCQSELTAGTSHVNPPHSLRQRGSNACVRPEPWHCLSDY